MQVFLDRYTKIVYNRGSLTFCERNFMDRHEYENTPKGKFIRQRQNSKSRGIAWEFTFEDWWKVWEDSGHWEDRGKDAGAYVMSRKGDVGPYRADNVEIRPQEENRQDYLYRRHHGTERPDPFRRHPRTSAWDYSHAGLDKWRAQQGLTELTDTYYNNI